MLIRRTAGILIAAVSAVFAVLVVGIATGVLYRQLGAIDPWFLVIPFFGFWPLVVVLSAAGIWSGIDLALHSAERRPLANLPSAVMALGWTLFAFGVWEGGRACATGPPDGLCMLGGAFESAVGVAVLVIGSFAVLAQWIIIRRGIKPPWENARIRARTT